MPAWRNSAQWRPPQFGIFVPAEFVPFLAWLLPGALGLLLLILETVITGSTPSAPERLSQLGIFEGYLAWTLIWSPLWSFPGIMAMFALRWILLTVGGFGWASAVVAGALAGITVPIVMGQNFWLAGPIYCATTLWMQQAIYRIRYRSAFDA